MCRAPQVYVAEVSPAKMRGFLGCFVQIHIAIGVTLVYLLGWWLIVRLGTEDRGAICWFCGWRLVAYLCAVPPLILGMLATWSEVVGPGIVHPQKTMHA